MSDGVVPDALPLAVRSVSRRNVACPACRAAIIATERPGGQLRPAAFVLALWPKRDSKSVMLRCPKCGVWTRYPGKRLLMVE